MGGRDGYFYSVVYNGQLLVERTRDPECDAARALRARGATGTLTMLDGKTGIPRTIINIEKAAKLRITDESRHGLRFRNHYPAGEPPSPEEGAEVGLLLPIRRRAGMT